MIEASVPCVNILRPCSLGPDRSFPTSQGFNVHGVADTSTWLDSISHYITLIDAHMLTWLATVTSYIKCAVHAANNTPQTLRCLKVHCF